jgi:hypothetical protein
MHIWYIYSGLGVEKVHIIELYFSAFIVDKLYTKLNGKGCLDMLSEVSKFFFFAWAKG